MKKMQKRLALLLAVLMMVITSCGPSQDAVSVESNTTAVAQQSATEEDDASSNDVADSSESDIWLPYDENGVTKRDERDATGENGMVASSNVYATKAGLQILEQGGNAVDAAIAVGYTLGVAEPFTSGIGGGGFMMIHTAEGENSFLDYREVASAAQTAQTWLDKDGNVVDDANVLGGLSIGVPGDVAGMEYALEKFGSGKVTRQQIMQPAIDLARSGYIVSPTMTNAISDSYENLIGKYTELGKYYLNDMQLPYEVGSVVTNPDLANTLEKIAEGGAEAFYKGEVAEALLKAVQKHGGLMTADDLANYKPAERTPVSSTYRGYQIISAPPASSGGTHLIEILNILENYDMGSMEVNSEEYLHLFSEAFKIAFADRAAYMADTDFRPDVPLKGLTSKEYAKQLSDQITDQSQVWKAGDPKAYEGDSTTSFSIADKEGNMVTVTQTIESFWGSHVAVEGYGFVLNNEMHDFSTDPNSVNCLEGGKRPLSSMTPTVVLDAEGKSFMTVGSPGGTRIFPTIAQVISHVIDHEMDIQDAINTARIFDDGAETGLQYESDGVTPVSPDVVKALEKRGHTLTDKGAYQLFFGGVQGIVYQKDGTLRGGADPRRDGKALGF